MCGTTERQRSGADAGQNVDAKARPEGAGGRVGGTSGARRRSFASPHIPGPPAEALKPPFLSITATMRRSPRDAPGPLRPSIRLLRSGPWQHVPKTARTLHTHVNKPTTPNAWVRIVRCTRYPAIHLGTADNAHSGNTHRVRLRRWMLAATVTRFDPGDRWV